MPGFRFNTRPQLVEALALMCPGASFRSDQNPETGEYDYDHVVWAIPDGVDWTPPSKEAVEQYLTQIQTEWDTYVKYQQLRKFAYPDIGEQMDALWHAMDEGVLPKIEPMYSDIKAVKEQFEKNNPDLPWRGSARGTILGAYPSYEVAHNPAISLPPTMYEFPVPPLPDPE